jgi:enamine deaminase RidA (YjgF/YER057c/UK114 family)
MAVLGVDVSNLWIDAKIPSPGIACQLPLPTPTLAITIPRMSPDQAFQQQSSLLGYSFEGPMKVGGNYSPVLRDGDLLYVSGQIPRVGDEIVVVGAAGAEVSLEKARLAAKVSTMRALALVSRAVGSLGNIAAVLRMTVFVRSESSFTQQSEVADGASDLLAAVLGPVGIHTRTSVGVTQLPKGATVEIDFIFKVREAGSS